MKLNELVCPACGLKCLVDAACTTCDGCNTYFTAPQSRSRDLPEPLPGPGFLRVVLPQVTLPTIPLIDGSVWTVTVGDIPTPSPSVECGRTMAVTDPNKYMVIN